MTYAIPKARANYEIFDTRFQGAKVWNDIGDDIVRLFLSNILRKSLTQFLFLDINCRFTKTIFYLAFRC